MSGRGRGISNTPAWMNKDGEDDRPSSRPARPPDYFDDRPMPRNRPPHRDYGRDNRGDYGGGYDRRRGGPTHRGPPPRGGGGRRGSGPRGRPPPPGVVIFRSREEEDEWVAERRRKRLARPSKFDVGPSSATASTSTAVDPAQVAAAAAAALAATAGPQQTRHARRLYVGNLPVGVTEEQIHQEFRRAIERAHVPPPELTEDPILSVYINHERRFCFIEFKSVEMTTACLQLDGYQLHGQPLKLKRPNDYNAALAPRVHPSAVPQLDVSRLGLVSGTVLDGPNKIFIGGLHYHLTDNQVLELLQAFGAVKAFHLVKADAEGLLSKGYCFIEYADPNVTATAIAGLNGMDIGGGKTLTARLAGDRGDGGGAAAAAAYTHTNGGTATTASTDAAGQQPPPDRTIVHGYDIEALVDAAMGKVPMPTQPVYTDAMGVPLTRIVPLALSTAAAPVAAPPMPAPAAPSAATPSRVLVLHNMVQPEDLASTADHAALLEEVREECTKFGTLLDVVIPRDNDGGNAEPSAVGKIFLRYASVDEATRAQTELQGRAFGDAIVQVTTLLEDDFSAGRLR